MEACPEVQELAENTHIGVSILHENRIRKKGKNKAMFPLDWGDHHAQHKKCVYVWMHVRLEDSAGFLVAVTHTTEKHNLKA